MNVSQVLAALDPHRPVVLHCTALQVFCLIAQVQLASRHPGNQGPSREVAGEMMRRLQKAIAPENSELWRHIERGWHEVFDVAPGVAGVATVKASAALSPGQLDPRD